MEWNTLLAKAMRRASHGVRLHVAARQLLEAEANHHEPRRASVGYKEET